MSHDHAAHDKGHKTAHAHPSGATYLKVAVILTLITAVEVWLYYIPAAVASPLFNPTMLAMSGAKFAIVVLFYMHLKYDHKLFKALFAGPLIVAMGTILALLFLFHQLSIRF